MLQLRSHHLTVSIDVTTGAAITYIGTPGGSNVLAHYDWTAPLHPERSRSYGSDRLDWLASYRGGWQELFPNAGAACEIDGIPLPFHGEVSTARWDIVTHERTAAVLRCPARLPLVLERTVELASDGPTMFLRETVHNESELEVPFIWGHHPAFDTPPGTHIDLPPSTYMILDDQGTVRSEGNWPVARTDTGEADDLSIVPAAPLARVVYLTPREPWYALRPPAGPGVAASWDASTFSRLWFWQELGSASFPFYGRARITALEPVCVAPGDGLAAAHARGEALTLGPRSKRRAWMTLSLFPHTERAVGGVGEDGTVRFA